MGTKFEEIYQANELIKNDNRLTGKTANNLYKLYFEYLKYAISLFASDCYKDLYSYTPFSQQEYYFKTNGTDNMFQLSPAPPSNPLFYVGKSSTNDGNYTEITDFTYNNVDQALTINGDILPSGIDVYISAYVIGEFTETLNLYEINILSEGMLVPWDQEQLHKNSLLNQIVYGGSQKLYSQGEHIRSVNSVVESQYFAIFQGMISDYSYKYSPDNLKRLGGQL